MALIDATQKGVSSEDGNPIDTATLENPGELENQVSTTNEGAERPLSPREVAMAAIKVSRETDDEADQLAAQLAATPTITPEPEPSAGPRVLSEADLQARVRVKIDGVEQEVTVADMQRQFQKNGAADRRLAEATRLLNEAQLREQQQAALTTPPARIAPNGGTDDSTPTPADGDDSGAKAFLSSLFEGDEDKAAAALQKLLGGRSQQAPTQLSEQELAAKLTPVIKQQLVAESALEQFAVDNPDIVQDPYLADMADGFLDAEVEAGKPYVEALGTAAKKTRDWLASKGVKPPEAPAPTMDRTTKLERKASIDTVPALNKAASTTVEPEQSASEVIAAMRKARGLD